MDGCGIGKKLPIICEKYFLLKLTLLLHSSVSLLKDCELSYLDPTAENFIHPENRCKLHFCLYGSVCSVADASFGNKTWLAVWNGPF